jgi:hypothetical protein
LSPTKFLDAESMVCRTGWSRSVSAIGALSS